jgi:hypothetical protein
LLGAKAHAPKKGAVMHFFGFNFHVRDFRRNTLLVLLAMLAMSADSQGRFFIRNRLKLVFWLLGFLRAV